MGLLNKTKLHSKNRHYSYVFKQIKWFLLSWCFACAFPFLFPEVLIYSYSVYGQEQSDHGLSIPQEENPDDKNENTEESSEEGSESILEEVSENDVASEGELSDEIELSQEELRQSFGDEERMGLALGLGATRPWLFSSLSSYWVNHAEYFWELTVGLGKHRISGQKDHRHLEMVVDSRAIDVGYHRFFSLDLPITYNLGFGLASWKGEVNPSGVTLDEQDPAGDALRSGYAASGIYLFLGIGLNFFWENGFYLQYTIVGLGKSKVFEHSLTQKTSSAEPIILKNLETGQSYGFTNIKLGWMF